MGVPSASSPKPHVPAHTPAPAASKPQPKPAPQAAAKPKDTFEPAKPAPKPQPTQGQQQAQDAVKTKTVGDERKALEKGGQEASQKNTRDADRIFSQSKSKDPNRAELVDRNQKGEITSRTVAIRNGDQTTVEKTTWEKGKANYSSTTTGKSGDVSTTQASWKADPSKHAQPSPNVEQLKNSRDPNVQVQQQSIQHDGNKLQESEYSQGKTGITQTNRTYFQQSKDDATHTGNGIKDDFEKKFSDQKPVDVVNTHTVSIPAGGQKQATPQVSDSATFSQDGLRLERNAGTQQYKLDGSGPAKDFHPAASDLANPDKVAGFDKGDKTPVQWKLEETQGNTYKAQTFVEGHTDLSTTTQRVANGSSVTETVSGKVPSADGKGTTEISSKTEQTYAKDGSLAHLYRDAHDPDGTHTVTNFDRTTKPGPNGLDINEHLNVQRTGKDGQTFGIDRKTESRLSNQGVQLVSSDETIKAPTGTTARTRLDATGTKTFIDGAEVNGKKDLANYSQDAQHLAALSGADTFKEATTYFNRGGVNAVKLLGIGGKIDAPAGHQLSPLADANNAFHQKLVDTFGEDNVSTAFRAQAGAAGALGALGGVAGAVTNTNDVLDGIRDQDFGKIAKGLGGDVASGMAIKGGGKAFYDAVKGLSPEALSAESKAANTALRTAGWLDKVPGISGDLATSGGVAAGTASKLLGKVGGIGPAIGIATSGYDLYNAINGGNGYKIAEAGVGLAGAVATGAVLGSVEPGLGTAIGAGIGLATFGVQKLIGLFDHSDTDIADVKI